MRFSLAVDDFGIKYFSKDNSNHLIAAVQDKYTITIDWSGDSYLRLTIDWNYEKGYFDISIPDYVPRPLYPSTCSPCIDDTRVWQEDTINNTK